ncbi:ThiF family adenylyltransferase [Paenibacillus sp. GYB003]|uniref:ThiF family adenylyltransferase n=1 Tax=Paenibacillus sp. GYB003 TaxID=2994392 RepID=UPI002F964C5C
MPNGLHLKKRGKTRVLYQIVVIGCGANGSHFIRGLCQDISTHLRAAEKKYNYEHFRYDLTIVDGDRVEPKNLDNQLFCEEDVEAEEYKAVALAERYGEHYGITVKRFTSYVKDVEVLKQLFPELPVSEQTQVIPVLVGMVDNNRTRQLLDDFFYSDTLDTLIYIDAGVEGVLYSNSDRRDLTDEEKKSMDQSGFGGQIVCGLKFNGEVVLAPVAQIFSNIWEDALSHFPGESCGDLITEAPQRCATNKLAAQLANTIMNNLFHSDSIYTHVINFNAQTGCSGGMDTFINDATLRSFQNIKEAGPRSNDTGV